MAFDIHESGLGAANTGEYLALMGTVCAADLASRRKGGRVHAVRLAAGRATLGPMEHGFDPDAVRQEDWYADAMLARVKELMSSPQLGSGWVGGEFVPAAPQAEK